MIASDFQSEKLDSTKNPSEFGNAFPEPPDKSLAWLAAENGCVQPEVGPSSISDCRNSREQMDVVRKWLAIALRGGSLTLATD